MQSTLEVRHWLKSRPLPEAWGIELAQPGLAAEGVQLRVQVGDTFLGFAHEPLAQGIPVSRRGVGGQPVEDLDDLADRESDPLSDFRDFDAARRIGIEPSSTANGPDCVHQTVLLVEPHSRRRYAGFPGYVCDRLGEAGLRVVSDDAHQIILTAPALDFNYC
jgi:hypothetical protein